MQLEVTGQPIRYRLKTGEEVTLRPGVPMELPDQAATQLLRKAPGKVRAVAGDPILAVHPGSRVTWESPLFGQVTGTVTAVCVDGFLEVHHPLTEHPTTIPLSWVVRREEG
jgi:hypothetical protein